MLSVFFFGAVGAASIASAQYMGNVDSDGDPIAPTLEEPLIEEPLIEEPLIEVRERMGSAEANPASGSGTPYLDANGVVGASVIAGAVFGGIAGAFFLRGRSGKYAAMGRDKTSAPLFYYVTPSMTIVHHQAVLHGATNWRVPPASGSCAE